MKEREKEGERKGRRAKEGGERKAREMQRG